MQEGRSDIRILYSCVSRNKIDILVGRRQHNSAKKPARLLLGWICAEFPQQPVLIMERDIMEKACIVWAQLG